jgi:hypothetical protein
MSEITKCLKLWYSVDFKKTEQSDIHSAFGGSIYNLQFSIPGGRIEGIYCQAVLFHQNGKI